MAYEHANGVVNAWKGALTTPTDPRDDGKGADRPLPAFFYGESQIRPHGRRSFARPSAAVRSRPGIGRETMDKRTLVGVFSGVAMASLVMLFAGIFIGLSLNVNDAPAASNAPQETLARRAAPPVVAPPPPATDSFPAVQPTSARIATRPQAVPAPQTVVATDTLPEVVGDSGSLPPPPPAGQASPPSPVADPPVVDPMLPTVLAAALPPSPVAAPWTVQIGAYGRKSNAAGQAAAVRRLGYDVRVVRRQKPGRDPWYYVFVGGHPDRESARNAALRLKRDGRLNGFATPALQQDVVLD